MSGERTWDPDVSINGSPTELPLFLLFPQVLPWKRVPHPAVPCVLLKVEMMSSLVQILLWVAVGLLICDSLITAVSV